MEFPDPVREITREALPDDDDWPYAFGEIRAAGLSDDIESPDGTDTSPVSTKDVVEVIAASNGENDGDSWVGVFRLVDGRYLAVSASCDYTGWH